MLAASSATDLAGRKGIVYSAAMLRANSEGRKARRFAVMQPAKFELVINARTAKVLGLAVISCLPWPTRLSSKSSQPCTPFISVQGQQLAHADHPSCEGATSGIHVGCDRCACGKGLGGGTVSRQS